MSTTPINSLTGTSGTSSTSALTGKNSLNSSDFIQMMLTELQNQDPLNPTDSQALLSQMSSIGQLQSADQLQTTLTQFSLQNQISSAGNLIGKTIQGLDSSNPPQQTVGIVTGVAVQNNQVWLTLSNNDAVQMNNVEQIVNTPTSTATTPGTPVTGPTPTAAGAPASAQTNQAAAAALVQRLLGGAA